MANDEHPTLNEFKDDGDDETEQWISVTLKVSEIVNEFEAEWVPNGGKAKQAGILQDSEGTQIPFTNWENSNQPELEEGETYEFDKLFMVYGQNNDGYTLIFRSDTQISQVGEFPGGLQGGCPYCGSDITDEHYGEGPEFPEVGWEYYECPECGKGIRPELV